MTDHPVGVRAPFTYHGINCGLKSRPNRVSTANAMSPPPSFHMLCEVRAGTCLMPVYVTFTFNIDNEGSPSKVVDPKFGGPFTL
jgi:hypothetical protein